MLKHVLTYAGVLTQLEHVKTEFVSEWVLG